MLMFSTQDKILFAFLPKNQSSLCIQQVAQDPRFLHADSKDSDQTGQMPRLIGVFAGLVQLCWFCGALAHLQKTF